MNKLNRVKIKKIVAALKPFWWRHAELQREFFKKQEKLEQEMTKELGLGINLEFFYCNGECCGVGAKDFSDRKVFPLIHDTNLYRLNN